MSEKTKSWKSVVQANDPNRDEKITVYTFGNGKRVFTEKQNKGYN